MVKHDNYQIQAQQAKDRFLTYDQEALIAKLSLEYDGAYLYLPMLGQRHRISRTTGDMERQTETGWVSANGHGEVMTLLDLICDSWPGRFPTGRWKNMASFGLMFHQNLNESGKDPWAERFQADPEGLRRACEALKGRPLPTGDISYAIELFDGLCMVIQLWLGDEEFPPNLRILWDENALMYIKYETMYFAKGLLMQRIGEYMAEKAFDSPKS